jgi:hypothetical protein
LLLRAARTQQDRTETHGKASSAGLETPLVERSL